MGKKIVGVRKRGKKTFLINFRDHDGIRRYETVTAETIEEASNIRAARLLTLANGIQVYSKPNTVLFDELAADVIVDYKHNGHASWKDAEARFRLHILPVFGRVKAAAVTTAMLRAYRVQRLEAGASVATVNRELEGLRHAYYLAMEATPPKVLHMPHVPIVKERNVRKGFFERPQLDALCRHLPAYLIPPVQFAYITGWRRGEVLSLSRRHIHFDAGEVRLEAGETKNEEGRTFPMVGELRQLLMAIIPERGFPNDLVFTGPERAPLKQFSKTWATACRAAGLPVRYVPLRFVNPSTGKREPAIYKRGPHKGKPRLTLRAAVHFHDFRRTAYRNLVRMGVPESVARAAVGWIDSKTADRYNITAQADLDTLRDRYDAKHSPSSDPKAERKSK